MADIYFFDVNSKKFIIGIQCNISVFFKIKAKPKEAK